MPGHWGRPSRPSRPSRGSPHRGGGGGPPSILNPPTPTPTPTPVTTGGPPSILSRPTPTVTTGGPPSILSRPTPTVTTGGPPSILSRQTPVTTAVAPPSILSRGPSPGITHPFLRNKRIRENLIKRKKIPGYWDFAQSLVNPWETEEWAGDQDPNITLGTRGIMKGLKDYMFDKGITSLQNLPPSEKVWMAHAPKPTDFRGLIKGGFKSVRPESKLTNLISPRSYEELLRGKNPLTSTGVYTAVGRTEKEVLEAAGRYGKPWYSRGAGAPVHPSKIFTAEVPRGTYPISRGTTRIAQMEVPAHIANKLKAADRFGKHTVGIGDKGLKIGAMPAKGMIKSTIGRLLPGAGAVLGGASALKHYQAGDYGQAAMAGLSMVPGPVGWLGLAGEMGLGAFQKWRQNQAQGGIANLYRHGGFSG